MNLKITAPLLLLSSLVLGACSDTNFDFAQNIEDAANALDGFRDPRRSVTIVLRVDCASQPYIKVSNVFDLHATKTFRRRCFLKFALNTLR